jgi:hypothetical protein
MPSGRGHTIRALPDPPGLIRVLGNSTLERDTAPIANQISPIALAKDPLRRNRNPRRKLCHAHIRARQLQMPDVNPADDHSETRCALIDRHPRPRIETLMPCP